MENTFVDGQEKVGMDTTLDFVTVRNSEGRFLFMGERKNIKCFNRLKKVSERVFETLTGQTYKFLDKMPEPEKPKEPEFTPAMAARAEASWRLHCMTREAGTRAASPVQALNSEPVLSFEEKVKEDWRTRPNIREEFVSLASYEAYMKAQKAGRARLYGRA